jgi:membrane protease YdiL (CAAX protease family)
MAAYAAVLATPGRSPLSEFHSRLFRWRLGWWWYVLALGLPFALRLLPLGLTALFDPALPRSLTILPWYMFFPVFLVMILGGGLEEPGWRGVAQPEVERRLARPLAALLVGLAWALWHLPLFFIPGQIQYHDNFPLFALSVIGNALILAWLYGWTRSILLCIFFHAGLNTVAALGLNFPATPSWLLVFDAAFRGAAGMFLLFAFPAQSARLPGLTAPTPCGPSRSRRP